MAMTGSRTGRGEALAASKRSRRRYARIRGRLIRTYLKILAATRVRSTYLLPDLT